MADPLPALSVLQTKSNCHSRLPRLFPRYSHKNPAATLVRQSIAATILYAHMTRAAMTIAMPSTPVKVSCS